MNGVMRGITYHCSIGYSIASSAMASVPDGTSIQSARYPLRSMPYSACFRSAVRTNLKSTRSKLKLLHVFATVPKTGTNRRDFSLVSLRILFALHAGYFHRRSPRPKYQHLDHGPA